MTNEIAQLLRKAAEICRNGHPIEGGDDIADGLDKYRASLEAQEPVAVEYQHEDTGQIGFVDLQQVEWGFFENNPRLQEIGPLYRHPPSSAPQDPDIGEVIDERDYWHDRATELAERVGEHFGIDVGEHTSANCPVANAIVAAWPTSAVPEGWQLVPVDLTEEMLDAWFNVPRAVRAGAAAFDPAYKAMLAAAPQQARSE